MRHYATIVFLCTAGCFAEPNVATAGTDDGSSSGSASSEGTHLVTTEAPAATSTTRGSDSGGGSDSGYVDSSPGSSSAGDGTGGESSSSTGDLPGVYGDCYDGPVVGGERLCPGSCVAYLPGHSACAPPCAAGCESGPDDAPAACLGEIADGVVAAVCILTCSGTGAPCPLGMECVPTEFFQSGDPIWACMWP